MGRAKGTSVQLQDLRTVFDHQRFEAALSRLRENAVDAIHIVESLRLQNLKTSQRSELGEAVYSYGKYCLDSGEFKRAAHASRLETAHRTFRLSQLLQVITSMQCAALEPLDPYRIGCVDEQQLIGWHRERDPGDQKIFPIVPRLSSGTLLS